MTIDRYIFDDYEPKSLGFAGYFDPAFHEIVDIASSLLERFSPDQIIRCIRHYDDYFYMLDPEGDYSPDEYEKNGDPHLSYCSGPRAGYLIRAAEKGQDLSEAFGEAIEPYEALAMEAFAIIAMATREEPKLEKAGDVEKLYFSLARYAIAGSEVIYTAKVLKLNPNMKLPVEDYRKSIASQGGKGKSERYMPLKKAVHAAWLDRHQGRSNKEAARRIWSELSDQVKHDAEGKPILNPAEPEATVARWIGNYSKGNTP